MSRTRREAGPRRGSAIGAAVAVATVAACGGNVGIEHVGPEESAQQISTNALSDGVPSASSMLVLRGNGLAERFEDEPREVLDELETLALDSRGRDVAFAIAELAFLEAVEQEDRGLYLEAACFAWFCLFDDTLGARFYALDPRLRLSADLYNRSITEAFVTDAGDVLLKPGPREVAGRMISFAVDKRAVRFDLVELPRLLPSAEYAVVGLNNRHRRAGLGAPMIAVTAEGAEGPHSTREALSRPTCAGATFLVRLDGGIDGLHDGTLTGTLELHQPAVETDTQVGDQTVPLENDISATIAYFVQGSKLLDFELLSFLGGNSDDEFAGMYTPMPYARGRIPVVLVHGTNSSIARWVGMLNDLFADPLLRDRVQIWFFTYPSGLPVPISADRLREAITDTRRRFDPEDSDPALDSILVIGHSQGGLLCRHLVTEDDQHAVWDAIFTRPFADLQLEPEARALAERIFFSKPVPFVTRAVYICTPHLGSYQADRWYTRLFGNLVTIPANVVGFAGDLLLKNRDALQQGIEGEAPSALNGMRTDNPYLLALAKLPVAKGVHQHCICGISSGDDPPAGNDGVVGYDSANLAGADSTFLVRYGHSCQSDPHVVNEVRRILREHVADYDRRRAENSKDLNPEKP